MSADTIMSGAACVISGFSFFLSACAMRASATALAGLGAAFAVGAWTVGALIFAGVIT